MSFKTSRRAPTASIAVLVVSLTAVITIAYRHYRSSLATFEPGPPNPALDNPDSAGVIVLQSITFQTPRGTPISGWYSPSRNGASIVLLHGTNADRTSLSAELRFLAAKGFGVLAYDGPGYGKSGGKAFWGAEAEAAALAAVDWLRAHEPFGLVHIGGLGHSMGGYTLIQAATSDSRIESLVLEAVPPNFVDATRWQHRKWGPISEWPALRALRFSPELLTRPTPLDLVAGLAPRPLLVVSGDQDQTVPLRMTRTLFSRAGEQKELWVIPIAGHGDFVVAAPKEYPSRIVEFFTRTLLSGHSPVGDSDESPPKRLP